MLDIAPYIKDVPVFFNNGITEENIILKIKQLLIMIASVMMPNTPRDGFRTEAKGYIIVKYDGNLVGFYIYNENEFGEYLINNIKLDTPSTSRYGIGVPILENGEYYIYLNLQLRFIG
ncbi:DNA (cytosine-5)-methyltransferase 1/type II restriction enzyme [Flexibacter flexilis DSM 6793]|uniref:DNA (Cytosine-5)-methyltransferase 1/type II restriction enzyme n=1 Tax=Flexibacter flexilis DSM 6793 TaxID=927664 RepID=A0A1I1NX13_9BACT|nr:HpaII family restriction endonuclease [Flexibacter flexilis]SFD02214.1 DNA (cytosine-5)-methyltransferase 1/type II restriction enzyme [Flexibacter flexilis DSM 6793]